jgi:SPP1 family predicted phage head-tail adaptor
MITISDLRERVAIQSATVARDAYNAETLTWATSSTVWAAVRERGGREVLITDRPTMIVGYEVTIRDGVTIDNHDRLVWGSKTLGIESVTPLQAQGLIVMRCLEVGA